MKKTIESVKLPGLEGVKPPKKAKYIRRKKHQKTDEIKGQTELGCFKKLKASKLAETFKIIDENITEMKI